MAKRTTKKTTKPVRPQLGDGVEILNAGSVLEDPITSTLETNYMPYAMSVIVSRALPEIDGFKPAHRKLLYTMYGMGLLKGARTKSANIVGSTMHLNPHGDAAIYDTMVRMGRGNESLLVPFVDSKGNFGKAYSRDMSCAAARYTEAKLEGVCEELFRDIDKETVDFVPNYDGTTTEPTLLPVTFPTILANNTLGIAVGMACNICSFNLAELCATTVALMKDPKHDISTTMPAPDFVGGGQILYDEAQMREVYENGRGSIKVRARYNVVPGENMLEITQIPPTTTVEAIMDKIAELVKAGKIKEISDMRDETDLNGLKLTLDLKRGVDPEKLMAKLYKTTPLEDSFSCNFNVLVSGQPRVMGVREILQEWTAFRMECVRRRTYYDLHGKEKRLHLLKGLAAILLDIDKAIHIIRTTEEETEVVPNLMIGFGIDEVQADYVAEIKLRHLNREYILKRTGEIEQLEKDIADLNDVLAKPARIRRIIINELNDVAKKYAQPRRSEILYDLPEEESGAEEESIPDYPVTVFFTREGYLKKIPPQSLRTAGAHKLKEGDEIIHQVETRNNVEALFFTDKQQVYKVRLNELEDGKVAQMGIYLPGRLGMDEGENILAMVITGDYSGYVLFFFEGGKCAKIPLVSYATKQNRRKLLKAYSDKEPLAKLLFLPEDTELAIRTTEEESEVVPNLMIGFGIDEVQADYVAEIKLRHLNREYILKRTSEIEQLEKDIADLNDVLAKPARVRRIIINELNEVAKKYAQPRRSEILYDLPEEEAAAEEETVPDYPVTVFFTREGYLKKIPPQSLRTAGAHKLKEGDEIVQQVETRNNVEALFFTDKQQVYKVRLAELEDGKVAQMGIFVPGRLGMDEGENILAMVITGDYSGFVLFFFASGKCAKIPLSSYATKQNRRKLLKAYCDKEPLAKLLYLPEETELAIRTSASRMLLVGTAQIAAKATRDSQGVAVVTLKKNQTIASVVPADTLELANPHRYRVRSLPATGALIRAEDEGEQMSLL